MPRKAKVGKARRDKAYWAAKEIGYRSRASFKLIQLNRKFEFLQKSRVCIDLCAAPGSWMQVAHAHMPVSSLIIGIDLVPIKPIAGCICLQGDITTEKCRTDLKKELQTWKADTILHDGAPNVGKNWLHDAYQQSLLTLSAFKLATEFLIKGGTFVTKVFRSKDYQSLMWVFNQFFRKVQSTKPAASRNESAEIFVVCAGYKAPDKIDPKFLDPKHVFSEVEELPKDEASERELINPEKKKSKAPAEGYETGATILYKKVKASEFIMDDKPIHILNNFNEIILDEPRIYKHAKTTQEVKECCKDLKVLGMKELRLLKKWRETLREEFLEAEKKTKEQKDAAKGNKEDEDDEDEDDKELRELDKHIETMKDEEKRAAKRQKKKSLKEKRKTAEKIDLKMVIPGDQGPTMQEDQELFQMKKIKKAQDMNNVAEQDPDTLVESDADSDEERKKKKKLKYVSREKGVLDESGLYYKDEAMDSDDEPDSEDDEDEEGLGFSRKSRRMKEKQVAFSDVAEEDEAQDNPLLVDLDDSSRDLKRKRKADLWFERDVFKNIIEDTDLAESDVAEAVKHIESKGKRLLTKEGKEGGKPVQKAKKKKSGYKSDSSAEEEENEDSSSDSSDDDSEDEEESYSNIKRQKVGDKDGFEVVAAATEKAKKKKQNVRLTPEELALGQEMIMSKKRKRDVLDAGWNRYMFNERDEDLPDWFVKEEQMHMRKHLELDQNVVERYRGQQKELNVKTIKKVVEAKARKKKRMTRKLQKAKKKAAGLLENPDMGDREKANEIRRMYKRAAATEKREVKYVVAKRYNAGKRATRPAGVKGLYKQVDPRMKKDTGGKRKVATNKRVQKRKLKGRHAKPSNQ